MGEKDWSERSKTYGILTIKGKEEIFDRLAIDDYAKDCDKELFTKMHCSRIANL